MKLAVVRQKYNPFGGAERFVDRALAALAAQGVTATLITREWRGASPQPVRLCNPFHVGRLWRDAGFAACVRRIVDAGEFDLVQSHERIAGCHIYRAGDGVHATWLELRGRSQTPLGRAATAAHPWHRYTLAAEARMFRDPALEAVICNSRMVRDDIARRFGVADERLHVIYNGVDLAAYHPQLKALHRARLRAELGIDAAAPLFLYVGSGFERKGVPQLLRAFALMKNVDAHLAIVGKDKRQRAMAALAASLGVAGRVRFTGGLSDVKPWYGAADAFVLPTLYDPFPNAALEALACALPVVTTPSCGAAELIRAGDNGYVCDALDLAQLADRMDMLALPGAAARMAQPARDSAAHLSIDATATQLTELYRRLFRDKLKQR